MVSPRFLTSGAALLGPEFPLPLDRPFTRQEVLEAGIGRYAFAELLKKGLVRRILRGVFAVAQLPDDSATRMAALRHVVPDDAVITDATACWVYAGAAGLAPNAHLAPQTVTVFRSRPGYRLSGPVHQGGERSFEPHDLTTIGGLRITTPLRTALDSSRLCSRIHAQAMVDALMRHAGVDRGAMIAEIERFRGFRGVRQGRVIVQDGDRRAESWGESVMRRHWLDTPGLPRPELQIAVELPNGRNAFLDMGVEELRLGAEYDGREWHGPDRAEHDARRRALLTDELSWIIVVGDQTNVIGRHRDIGLRLSSAYRRALERACRLR